MRESVRKSLVSMLTTLVVVCGANSAAAQSARMPSTEVVATLGCPAPGQQAHHLEPALRRAADRLTAPTPQSGVRRDALWNGVLIGAAAGGLLGLIPDYFDDCEECHDALYASIAVGAGVGLLVDALLSRSAPQVVRRVRLGPGRGGVGVTTRVTW